MSQRRVERAPAAKIHIDTVRAGAAASRRAKLFRRLPKELHLTLFSQGQPASERFARTTENVYMPEQSRDFSTFGRFSENFARQIPKNNERKRQVQTNNEICGSVSRTSKTRRFKQE